MNYRNYFKTAVLSAVLVLFSIVSVFAQNARLTAPSEQKLLNGMKLLVWNVPTADKTTIKLRIHSGAAFDPKDKMGVMALLSDIFFPTAESRAYFTEDLEGSFDVTTNYDYMQITVTGKSGEILPMLEAVSNAVTKPQVTDENLKLVRAEQIKKLQELEKNPAYIADRAVSRRLFGDTFPYGRSIEGTSESLVKIDHTDLLLAEERFVTADNATMVIIGNVKPDYAYRAARQLFGGWTKSDKKVPTTFRIPDAPVTAPQIINANVGTTAEIRTATRGLARSDKDYTAFQILLPILQEKWNAAQPFGATQAAFVRHQANTLPGIFIVGTSVPKTETDVILKNLSTNGKALDSLTEADFEKAKSNSVADFNAKAGNPVDASEMWLDADTYKLPSLNDRLKALQNASFADAKRVGTGFFDTSKQVVVIVSGQNGAQATN